MSAVPPPLPPPMPPQSWPPHAHGGVPPKSNSQTAWVVIICVFGFVAVLAVLAAIAVPGFLRARQRAQATGMKNDLRLIDAAKDQYAIETNKDEKSRITPDWSDLKPYFPPGSRLATQSSPTDLLGRSYAIEPLNLPPKIHPQTYQDLVFVCDAQFWSPFR